MTARRVTPILLGMALVTAGPMFAATGAGAEPVPEPTAHVQPSPRLGDDGQNLAEREFTGRHFADRKLSRRFAAYLRKRSGRQHPGGFTLSPPRKP
ncbi:hypothetical protein ACFYY8_16060 [Streptosporangium sp. NPDC001559]|uniref:hypothetical protein n=1 Tax=Streptosporangium sp. NPDC001559 TaxID=3366187 RepID=UPI0036E92DC6